jgi:hypothetical protein
LIERVSARAAEAEERVNDFTAHACLDLANAQRNGALRQGDHRDQASPRHLG